jgi:cob(I)alamin adenosyltransferase
MVSKIYTRTGDGGTTSLADGGRVAKCAPRIEAYGTIDEANACVGAARASTADARLEAILAFVQHRLYNCASATACAHPKAGTASISDDDIAVLERSIDELEEQTGAIRGFVLPGGGRGASLLHVARTVCRRAERRLVALSKSEPVEANVLGFVNRASDLLFAAARYSNRIEIGADVLWDKDAPIPRPTATPRKGRRGKQ